MQAARLLRHSQDSSASNVARTSAGASWAEPVGNRCIDPSLADNVAPAILTNAFDFFSR